MTPKFDFVACSIEESKDIDELQSSLLVHEKKINQQEKEEQALKASSEHHSILNRVGRERDRGRERGRGGRENNHHRNQQRHHQHQEFNLKEEEEEEEEDMEATTRQLIDQSQQTSLMLNAINVIGMAIINQNVELICIDKLEKEITLQKKKNMGLF